MLLFFISCIFSWIFIAGKGLPDCGIKRLFAFIQGIVRLPSEHSTQQRFNQPCSYCRHLLTIRLEIRAVGLFILKNRINENKGIKAL